MVIQCVVAESLSRVKGFIVRNEGKIVSLCRFDCALKASRGWSVDAGLRETSARLTGPSQVFIFFPDEEPSPPGRPESCSRIGDDGTVMLAGNSDGGFGPWFLVRLVWWIYYRGLRCDIPSRLTRVQGPPGESPSLPLLLLSSSGLAHAGHPCASGLLSRGMR